MFNIISPLQGWGRCVLHFLEFEGCPDEGTDAFGIVVAYGFGEVVLEGAVATTVFFDIGGGFQHFRADARA